jgi:cytochrome P450
MSADVKDATTAAGQCPVFPFPRDERCPINPSPEYARVREERAFPKIRTWNGDEAWLVTGYDDAIEILADAESFSNDPRNDGYPRATPAVQVLSRGVLPMLDPPEHTPLRTLVNQEFNIKRIESIRPLIQRVVDDALEEYLCRPQPADFVAHFAFRVASVMICELLGVPYDDHKMFQECVEQCHGAGATVEQAVDATEQIDGYLESLLQRQEANPTESIVGRFVTTGLRTGLVQRDETLTLMRFMIEAGFDTTANTMSLGTLALLQHPDQLAALRDDPSLVRGAVEEILRYTSIIHQGGRRAIRVDAEIAGNKLTRGEGVIVARDAANRDGRIFENPDVFDIRRPNAKRHITFSYGIHLCAGSSLARAELQAVFSTLFQRVPTLHLAVPQDQLRYKDDSQVFGLYELPLAW